MKRDPVPPTAAAATLQDVRDRLVAVSPPDTRQRDQRSAVLTYAKLTHRQPAEIPLDLAEIRRTLDGIKIGGWECVARNGIQSPWSARHG